MNMKQYIVTEKSKLTKICKDLMKKQTKVLLCIDYRTQISENMKNMFVLFYILCKYIFKQKILECSYNFAL